MLPISRMDYDPRTDRTHSRTDEGGDMTENETIFTIPGHPNYGITKSGSVYDAVKKAEG